MNKKNLKKATIYADNPKVIFITAILFSIAVGILIFYFARPQIEQPPIIPSSDDGSDSGSATTGGIGGERGGTTGSGGSSGGGGGDSGGSGGGGGDSGSSCGNNICESGENNVNCPQDCPAGEQMPGNPNILVIITDDQRWNSVEGVKIDQDGGGQLDDYVMPNLKRFYDESVVFDNAFVSNPLCCPMRASFLSGGFPSHDTGVLSNDLNNGNGGGGVLFNRKDTIFSALSAAGIKTYLIGKFLNGFHTGKTSDKGRFGTKIPVNILVPYNVTYFLGNDNAGDWFAYELIEYTEGVNELGIGDIVEFGGEVTCDDGADNDHDNLIDEADPDCGIELKCKDGKDNDGDLLIDCGDGNNNGDSDCRPNYIGQCVPVLGNGEYNQELFRRKVIEQIGNFSLLADSDDRFFMYLALNAPHDPAIPEFDTDSEKVKDYVFDSLNYNEADISDKPLSVQKEFSIESQQEIQAFAKAQLASLQSTDRVIGKILDYLNQTGLAENTIVVFASDNGYAWGENRLTHKANPYEASIRVPLAIRVPGVSHKRVNDFVIVNQDVPTTVYSLWGIAAPTGGIDLTPTLLGGAARKEVTIESYDDSAKIRGEDKPGHLNNKGTVDGKGQEWALIRNFDWKYITRATTDDTVYEEELYDMQNDPYEMFNLLSNVNPERSNYLSIRDELKSRLFSNYLNVIIKEPFLATALPEEISVGQDFSYQFEQLWGQGHFRWSVYDGYYTADEDSEVTRTGTLPPGLSLTKDGLLTGKPTQPGTYTFVLIVEDSYVSPVYKGRFQNGRGNKAFSIKVTP